jgi:hypothetical protein
MGTFRTKLDFSDNRQVKQRIETISNLSGATTFGVPFSDLPTGPNPTLSSVTQTIINIPSTFSGNNTTTIFTWNDSRMSLGESVLSAITPSNSATTQNTGNIFTPNISSAVIIDGNTSYTSYSGVNYDVRVVTLTNLGGGNYSGDVTSQTLQILNSTGIDFTGRTIWNDVSGITRTNRLIITDNPQVGYTWTCIDSEGMGEWQYNGSSSGSTIWTAGTGINSAVLGGSNGIASGSTSVSEGDSTIAGGDRSHAEGLNTQALSENSHAEGKETITSGKHAHAEGYGSIATNEASHAEGYFTLSSGDYSHAEGANTVASGNYSHAEGKETIASGLTSHAEGSGTTASGQYSHAEGSGAIASGDTSHAQGKNTIASGNYSHAQGYDTIASGDTSHAEGKDSIASGYAAHAEGKGTIASGDYSHAEGFSDSYGTTIASGDYSHAEGWGSIASGDNSHAQGFRAIASGDSSHAGGYQTTVNSNYGFIHAYTSEINTLSNYSAILGGTFNKLSASTSSSIVGGSGNTLYDSIHSSILGGENNKILFNTGYGWGSLIGGNNNTVVGASNYFTILGGGNSVIADSNGAIIVSESSEITGSMDYSAILAGSNHEMTTDVYTGPANTVILGGDNSTYRNTGGSGLNNSAMIGGTYMSITGISNMNLMSTSNQSKMLGTVSYNTMIGNDNCEINVGSQSTIIGSDQSILGNVIQSTLFGTYQSTISGTGAVTSAFILGGEKHTISGPTNTADYSAIINGSTHTIQSARNAIIIGGSNVIISGNSDQAVAILSKDSYIDGTSINSGLYSTELSLITNSSNLSTITGGYINRILSSNSSSVLGGTQNIISGSSSFHNSIIGGTNNRLFGQSFGASIISSIDSHIYNGYYSLIIGNSDSIISGTSYSTNIYNAILGGSQHIINGGNGSSVIIGGNQNVLTATRSVIIGGQNITGTTNDTVYVPDLVIDGLTSTDPLATDSNGKIVAGTSDARLKQNINGLSNSLDVIKNLRGVSFEYTLESEMGSGIRYGFIAQEVQEFVPNIVRNRAKGDGMLSLNYNEIVPILVEAVKELSSGLTTSNNTHLETQTILAEDNNVELNFNGNQQTAIGGGLSILHAKGQDQSADLITDGDGNFITNNDFKPNALTIPLYTPTSSNDTVGSEGNITRDDNYMYVKTSTGWKRTNLENF